MNEPINVTPGGPPRDDPFSLSDSTVRSQEPEWAGWSWAGRGRGFPWLGVLLVLLGIGLLIQTFFPAVAFGTLVLLAIALAFLGAWLIGGSWLAMVPGMLILAVAAARLLDELRIYSGPGTTSLAVAIAFLLIWLFYYLRGRRNVWPLWGAAIFGLVGLIQVSGRIAGIPELGALWPLVVIGLGVLLLLGSRRRAT
jgi:hypothetical protein